ncbi:MAG: hypothetical protein H0X39_00040 [Actinobacteria bacterium]|nr:hypothetical protein [Actinomycetota bacterium]
MSSLDETEAAINDAINPPDPEPDVEETGADDGAVGTEAPQELIAGKFKTTDDAIKAYLELEREHTQARQQLAQYQQQPEPEAEQPEPYDPLASFAVGYDDSDRQQIANSTYTNPQETLEWAMSDEIAKWNPNLKNEIYQLWSTFAPMDAHSYAAKLAVTAEREQVEQLRSQWEQEQQSRQAETNHKTAVDAFKEASKLPEFAKYQPRIAELYTTQGPVDDRDPRLATPEAMTDYVKTLYARARLEEFEAQESATLAGQAPAKPAAGAKARTQTRSTASGSSGVSAQDQAFLDEVLAGQPGMS